MGALWLSWWCVFIAAVSLSPSTFVCICVLVWTDFETRLALEVSKAKREARQLVSNSVEAIRAEALQFAERHSRR